MLGNGSANTFPRRRIACNNRGTAGNGVFYGGPCRGVIRRTTGGGQAYTRMEAGSNTSTVTLRVVGGDKGIFKSETVKYGHESQGPRTGERLAGEGQQHIQKTDPSSRQRGRPTKTRP
jgi:hypothetical protein